MKLLILTIVLNCFPYFGNCNPKVCVILTDGIEAGLFNPTLSEASKFYNLTFQLANFHFNISDNYLNVIELENNKSEFDSLLRKFNYVLILTNKPIYIGEPNLGLRGYASGRIAIVSSFKVKSETPNPEEFFRILTKTTKHEIGHLLGLPHCFSNDKCFMVASTPQAFKFLNSNEELCDSCSWKIEEFINK